MSEREDFEKLEKISTRMRLISMVSKTALDDSLNGNINRRARNRFFNTRLIEYKSAYPDGLGPDEFMTLMGEFFWLGTEWEKENNE